MLKALALQQQLGPVFDITFDCEDGAPIGNEQAHATQVAALINSATNVFNRVGTRVHATNHPAFKQDVALLVGQAGERMAYLTLPKVHSVTEVKEAIDHINQIAYAAGISRNIPIHVLIETHGALREVFEIAALAQVECLSFGLMDFVSAHHGAIPAYAMQSPEQFEHPLVARAMTEIAVACHTYGKVPSHNVCTDIAQPENAGKDARRARQQFAYTRKWSIHPTQIRPILQAFGPDAAEINEAITILTIAHAAQWGPIQHAGRLHDYASYRYYLTTLKKAKNSGIVLSADVLAFLQYV